MIIKPIGIFYDFLVLKNAFLSHNHFFVVLNEYSIFVSENGI